MIMKDSVSDSEFFNSIKDYIQMIKNVGEKRKKYLKKKNLNMAIHVSLPQILTTVTTRAAWAMWRGSSCGHLVSWLGKASKKNPLNL